MALSPNVNVLQKCKRIANSVPIYMWWAGERFAHTAYNNDEQCERGDAYEGILMETYITAILTR